MQRFLLTGIALTLLLGACVPNKQIVYLQHTTEPDVNTVTNKDSLARSYATRYQEYILKPHDILSLRIGTLTSSEYDFIKKYEQDLGLLRKLSQYDQASQGSNQMQGQQGMGGTTGTTGSGGTPMMSSLMLDRQQTGFVLDEEGFLELPKIGRLSLAGLSIPKAEALVKEKLHGYFETPVVRIQLLNFHFTILGEVKKEGRYTIYDPNANVFDAITIAGNLTDFADRSKIKIVRLQEEKASVVYVNALRENLLEQPGFYLQPNDLIIVPPLEARATRTYKLPNATTAISLVLSVVSFALIITTLSR